MSAEQLDMNTIEPISTGKKSMFITQNANVTSKQHKTVKLPRIESANRSIADMSHQSSQSTELLKANREMQEVQQQLDLKKAEHHERMAKCKEKEETLAIKAQKLKSEEAKFQLFLKENDAKRSRALKRAQDEVNIRRGKEKEAEALVLECRNINDKLNLARSRLDEHLIYQTYLEKVVEHSEDFTEVSDILKRYQTLSATNDDLQTMVQKNIDDTETYRHHLSQMTKRLQNEVLVKSSEIAEHQERLEKARIETVIADSHKATREDEVKDGIRELGESQMAIFNLFNRCRATHMADSRPKQETKDPFLALRYIEERFRDLAMIVKDGYDQGVVGKVKVREAAVEKQAAHQAANARWGAAGQPATKAAGRPSKRAEGGAMTSHASQSGFFGTNSGSTLKSQPPLQ
ncbi:hypothetical protein GUITHDRAFT_87954 [Guillardia theta CCMP2712]|uniref:DUF4200 domain-containing protein n=1 Tax=Guillardia theta (strain CCMP2712) TaxID=905079 RepID=L1J2Q2_GUITC|nr:hypothetical protein GUITHDRAFT_87954 [Guillardia theta CCMP2712]EKX42793.1 hypothetical protein GUITHDRAFT_87954 [Guillardia theta CCMP2712]|mmetsp:Transcript_22448/g.73697  ORF Transcript_22448/g.73697 Transcript_22448/m.73697 type:complete len:405 (-) Transcript_22448:1580-2794(-)|eukprot:XP_005829773.1 hypothetical protein GUITHDRAFT_87954 [Guillardia theta CCMP2712]